MSERLGSGSESGSASSAASSAASSKGPSEGRSAGPSAGATADAGGPAGDCPDRPDRYKWLALSNTSLGMFMATVDSSIVIISMPAIFRGIHLDPFAPGNISYLLWMIMGYLLVTAVLVVTLGRLGDIVGRVRIYNLGFVVFTLASVALSFDPAHGSAGGAVADRLADRAGAGRLDAHGELRGDPHRRLPRPAARHGAGHQPDRGAVRPVHRPGAGRAAVGLGLAGDLLGQRARSASSAPSGRTARCARPPPASRPVSTGGATSPSPSAAGCCWSPSPTASSPTAATPWAGPAPRCWPG